MQELQENSDFYLFYDGDKCTWGNTARWALAQQLAYEQTGMKTFPLKKPHEYISQLEADIAEAEHPWPIASLAISDGYQEYDEEDYTREMVKEYSTFFWQCYFLPELTFLDKPYPHALPKLEEASARGFQCFLLSSNKEPTRKVRTAWLKKYGFGQFTNMILKPYYKGMPDELKYMKTFEWKSQEIWKRAKDARCVIFVDDMQANRQAVLELPWQSWQKIVVAESLEGLQLPSEDEIASIPVSAQADMSDLP